MTRASSRPVTRRVVGALSIAPAVLASACTQDLGPTDRIETIAPGDRRVAVTSPAFEAGRSRHVRFTGDWQQEEYAYFGRGGGRTEIIYAAVTRTPFVLNYQLVIRDAVGHWSFNRGKAMDWGETGRAGALAEPIFFHRYRLTGEGRDCFGFSAEWDYPSDDPQHRPGRVLFGYSCAPPGDRLSDERIADWVDSIRVNDPAERKPRSRQDPAERANALDLARGADGSLAGNPRFPFLFAERYNDTQGNGNFN